MPNDLRPIAKTVWDAMGFRGPVPPIMVRRLPHGYSGMQPFTNRNVLLRPEIARQLRAAPLMPGKFSNAVGILAHEFAHVNQPRVFPRDAYESGADAAVNHNLRKLMSALHSPQVETDYITTYWPELHRTLQRLGKQSATQFYRAGQYGRP